ncbi:MAG TPA: L,D-transpeptidase family protein [Flavobacteriaceae bacterium]|nr:L,D-transpeptidase family protein [Flavobacteriaceae bacterium]
MKKLQNFFLFFFCFSLFTACKNNVKIDKPITSEEISNWFKNNPENELFNSETTIAFYNTRDYAPAWNSEQTRASLLEQLEKASGEGLSFEDYHGKELQNFFQNKKTPSKNERIHIEVLLTDAYLKYADHLLYGKLDPKKIYEIWGVDRKEIDLGKRLQKAIENQAIEKSLADLKPQNEIYSGLKKSLLEYRKLRNDKTTSTKIEEGKVIKPGDTDERVPAIAERLKEVGVLEKSYDASTCIYDETLQNAVKEFQTKKGLANDVILGNSTLQELNLGTKDRYNQLLANLERWRWYPRNLGNHYILVNIPNYQLSVVKNGDTLRKHNVIAGDKTHHTPVFSDSVQYIVINPEWNIPTSIRNNEIIPKASSDPNYLESRNIYVTDSNGERVDPSTIDWSGNAAKNYRFTQGAGSSNALGQLKIIYPNQYAIYLHDTPAQAIFNQNSRAESHGCVRVQNVVELAAYLLSNQKEWSLERLKKAIASKETKRIKVTQPVQVHHFYWTAWRKEGETVFINDIYDLDKEIYSKL